MSNERQAPRVAATEGSRSEELPSEVVLEVSDVEKDYGSWLPFRRSVEVLTGVDLEVSAGEIVGVVGENGAGKSTLMKAIAGVVDVDDGSVSIDGRLGWCPQEPLVYDRLTVEETFRLFGEAYDMTPAEVDRAIDELTAKLGFKEYLDYQTRHLSGGNRQKVNLSVALMHQPDLLLLDEPYTGFDWETYLAFWELTEELTERDVGIVVISHLINDRERFDEIYELKDGLLHREGSTDG